MSFDTHYGYTYRRPGYMPNGSTEHDHLCNCPHCDPQPPDPTPEEIRADLLKALVNRDIDTTRYLTMPLDELERVVRRLQEIDGRYDPDES